MKQTLKRRICAAILCHILLLGLAGCSKANKAKPNDGGDSPVKASVDALKQGQPAADSEETVDGAESLARVRGDLEYDGRLTGAAAYLGLREKGDQTELTDWLRENCADLTSELPFLLEIPSERVLGAGYGKLFCIVPRDENTSLAVNHVTWQMMGNGLHPVADEVLYREEYAEPVLVFVDPEEPDKEVNLVTNDGVAALWYPQEDGYGNLILPTDEAGAPLLYDFAIYGYTTGLDYPEGWEPSGDDWWWPPTELGLADTSWLCDSWVLELRGGDAGPEYAGTADLYYAPAGYIKQDYLGVWRMEDDCLYLKLSADSGDAIDASFQSSFPPPARIFISSARARARGSPSCRTARTPSDCSCIQGKTAGASSAGLYSLHSACGISSQRRGRRRKKHRKKGTRSLFPMLFVWRLRSTARKRLRARWSALRAFAVVSAVGAAQPDLCPPTDAHKIIPVLINDDRRKGQEEQRGGPAAAPCAVERDADDGRHCPEDDVIGHKRDERDGKKQQERKAPV